MVLFESWHGAYNDSPRAISEELHRRGADFEHVWAVAPGTPDVPDWATSVEPQSRAYLEALGRAGHVVTNNTMPGYFRKKRSTAYLQTWHGTPLKRIAFDIPGRSLANQPKYLRALRRDVSAWDYLVSPNPFSTEVFRRAFRFEGEIVETGYPRNDLLSSPDRDAIRDRVRAALGIEPGVRAMLYAPTWRDDASFSLELDVAALLERLGDGHVLLLRAHQLVARTVAADDRPGLLDVSTYPDNRDLYLAADVLITDYSSAMFDFAVTGKPIVLFTYDLEGYRDRLRGFYFDFEREAPGPLLATSAEVIEALAELEAVRDRYRSAYDAFRRRFCGLEDGRASERVIEAVFDGGAG
ncbi:MAG: CDP-glycerol glycerophosphotransferase [Solirubrobacterales bacterium]|nr:CDP-glycerol glycerophosphotransferase [Solirubrobacterales bacterium]